MGLTVFLVHNSSPPTRCYW